LTLQQHILKYAVQAAKRFVTAPAWKGFIGQPYGAFANTTTDAALEAYIRQNSATYVSRLTACGQSAEICRAAASGTPLGLPA
jgi:nicotinamidase-related amidase